MHPAVRTYRVPVSLTPEQLRLIDSYRVAQRHSYNWVVSRIRSGEDNVTEYELHRELTVMRRSQEWMRAVPAWIQRAGIKDAFKAHKLSARFGRGRLAYRTRRNHSDISVICALPPRVASDGRSIILPCFGTVRVAGAAPNQLVENDPRSYAFVRTRSGRYVLYVACRVMAPDPAMVPSALQAVKGIDRGVTEPTVVVTLDGDGNTTAKDSYDTATPFKTGQRQHQKAQSKMSKMNHRSGRCRRLQAILRRRLQKTLRRREYTECIAAKHICVDHDPAVIVLEDLKLGRMTRRGRGRRHMNREMRFVRHRMIEQRIRNRAEMVGIRVESVNPAYTSQTCARCGHMDKNSRATRDMFRCAKCSYVQQADVNAALIIGGHGLPQAPDDENTLDTWQASEGGTPFVRRELDARLGCFVAAGGFHHGGHESQVPAHSHAPTRTRRNNVEAPS